VAAASRRPAEVVGTGHHTIEAPIEKQSRRRQAATQGESRIPLDEETRRCVQAAGYELDSILPEGKALLVRKAANLHTGGTIHDVTDQLHPQLVEAAVGAARAIDIPVVGLDFLVPSPTAPDYVIIEDRKSTRLNSSHVKISYAVFCLKKKKNTTTPNKQ